jgi:hypothetical protein
MNVIKYEPKYAIPSISNSGMRFQTSMDKKTKFSIKLIEIAQTSLRMEITVSSRIRSLQSTNTPCFVPSVVLLF